MISVIIWDSKLNRAKISDKTAEIQWKTIRYTRKIHDEYSHLEYPHHLLDN